MSVMVPYNAEIFMTLEQMTQQVYLKRLNYIHTCTNIMKLTNDDFKKTFICLKSKLTQ